MQYEASAFLACGIALRSRLWDNHRRHLPVNSRSIPTAPLGAAILHKHAGHVGSVLHSHPWPTTEPGEDRNSSEGGKNGRAKRGGEVPRGSHAPFSAVARLPFTRLLGGQVTRRWFPSPAPPPKRQLGFSRVFLESVSLLWRTEEASWMKSETSSRKTRESPVACLLKKQKYAKVVLWDNHQMPENLHRQRAKGLQPLCS